MNFKLALCMMATLSSIESNGATICSCSEQIDPESIDPTPIILNGYQNFEVITSTANNPASAYLYWEGGKLIASVTTFDTEATFISLSLLTERGAWAFLEVDLLPLAVSNDGLIHDYADDYEPQALYEFLDLSEARRGFQIDIIQNDGSSTRLLTAAAIPEPHSLGLIALGIAVLAFKRRKKNLPRPHPRSRSHHRTCQDEARP